MENKNKDKDIDNEEIKDIDNEEIKEENNSVILTIDARERDLIEFCEKNLIKFKKEALEIGDISISGNNIDTLLFERKTISDLVASIKDGRYKEQKQRIKSKFPFHRVTFIIEGSVKVLKSEKICGLYSKSVNSALISSRYRDGYHIIHTTDVADTMWNIMQIFDRFGDKTSFDPENGDYKSSIKVKTKKIENITPEFAYILQLSQLPGISVVIAQDIASIYPSFSKLILAINEKGVKAFDIVKGIGKARVKTIIDYIK